MLELQYNSKVYVACPAADVTGGTELLHQLASKLQKRRIRALMYYYPAEYKNPSPAAFSEYGVGYESRIEDEDKNVLVLPEVRIEPIFKYSRIRRVVWWLSVDNYYRTLALAKWYARPLKKSLFEVGLRRRVAAHLAQSAYAFDHLTRKGLRNVTTLSDYLNKDFLASRMNRNRRDIVAYNPKKGFSFMKEVMARSAGIEYVAIENFTRTQVVELLRTAKVYVDFGNHPGKDRIPREAAVSGCCVITGRDGSAGYAEDVPIPDEFKFESKREFIPAIIDRMHRCLSDYEHQMRKFDGYRNFIFGEEKKFDEDVDKIFVRTREKSNRD